MSIATVRIICTVLAALFLGLIVLRRRKQWQDDYSGPDLVEYAFMAGFVAAAAGAILPSVATLLAKLVGG